MAAMTCPGVPTHRKRLRPAERVETESALYTAIKEWVERCMPLQQFESADGLQRPGSARMI